MSSEDYEGLRDEAKQRKAKKRAFNTEYVQFITGEMELEVEEITEYHFRIKGGKRTLDYFPTSGKGTWVGSGKWFRIGNIEEFVKKSF